MKWWVWIVFQVIIGSLQGQSLENIVDVDLVEHPTGKEMLAYREKHFAVLHLSSSDSAYGFSYRTRSFFGVELESYGKWRRKGNKLTLLDFKWRSKLLRALSSKRTFKIHDGYLTAKGVLGISLSRRRFAHIPQRHTAP